jgi:hypothetical protein
VRRDRHPDRRGAQLVQRISPRPRPSRPGATRLLLARPGCARVHRAASAPPRRAQSPAAPRARRTRMGPAAAKPSRQRAASHSRVPEGRAGLPSVVGGADRPGYSGGRTARVT